MFPDMKSLQNLAVVFLDRDKLVYFNSVNNQIAVYNYPDKLVRFMEIVNSKELEMQLKLFINYHKLPPARLIFILSPQITFEKNFSEEKEDLQKNIIEDFLYHLPFENNVHKIYKLEKGFLLSAANIDFLQVFMEIFKNCGFTVFTVIPSSVTGMNLTTLDAPSVGFLLAKTDYLKEQTMIAGLAEEAHKPKEPEKKVMGLNRVYLLLGVFVLLFSFLLFMLYRQSAG